MKGDEKTTSVSVSNNGTTVHAKQNIQGIIRKYMNEIPQYVWGEGISAYYEDEVLSGLSGMGMSQLPETIKVNISGDGTYISACYPTPTSASEIVDPIQIKWIGTIPGGGFKAPDYSKL